MTNTTTAAEVRADLAARDKANAGKVECPACASKVPGNAIDALAVTALVRYFEKATAEDVNARRRAARARRDDSVEPTATEVQTEPTPIACPACSTRVESNRINPDAVLLTKKFLADRARAGVDEARNARDARRNEAKKGDLGWRPAPTAR
ncbi:hypothetical protein [Tsukamurella strandjordii]|uniref:Uncharacterized protein n=1 Tax=Tsukamurella strandjordii TaxID=147577 RepID=A0AA90SRG0_9ACTN|nr:hypothetical protein [Tsukamurella strandjordii]MDP0398931.1 hypothetical protein [Tsukamurella strandjordii]